MDTEQTEAAFEVAFAHQKRTKLEASGVAGWMLEAIERDDEAKKTKTTPVAPGSVPPLPPPRPVVTAVRRGRAKQLPPVPLFQERDDGVPVCSATDAILLHLYRAWSLQWQPKSAEREAADSARVVHSDAADPVLIGDSKRHRCDSSCPRFDCGDDFSICQICGDFHICGKDCPLLTPADELGSSFVCCLTCRSFVCDLRFEMWDRSGSQTHASWDPVSRSKGIRKRKAQQKEAAEAEAEADSGGGNNNNNNSSSSSSRAKKKRKLEHGKSSAAMVATAAAAADGSGDADLDAFMTSPQTSREARDTAMAQHTAEATSVIQRVVRHAGGEAAVSRLGPLIGSATELVLALWVLVQQTDTYKSSMGAYPFQYHCFVVLYDMICGFSRKDGAVFVPFCAWMRDNLPSERQLEQLFGIKPNLKTRSDKLFRICIRSVSANHATKLLAKSIGAFEAAAARCSK